MSATGSPASAASPAASATPARSRVLPASTCSTCSRVSIFDAGAIIGTGGTAIEFAGSGNTLTLGAGYLISGIVDPLSGSNTFQLGGMGSDTFDLSPIG